MQSIYYHESKLEKPYIPPEDFAASREIPGRGVLYIVADGITLEVGSDGLYPIPSDAAEVAHILCEQTIQKFQAGRKDALKEALVMANKEILNYNQTRDRWIHRDENAYSFGAAVGAAVFIDQKDMIVYYAIVEDCYAFVYGTDGTNRLEIPLRIVKTAKHFRIGASKSPFADKLKWRRDIRNHFFHEGGEVYGYGAFDGNPAVADFIMTGYLPVQTGDVVLLFTDGFLPTVEETEFIQLLQAQQSFTMHTYEAIASYLRAHHQEKEKSMYIIRI